MEYTSNVIVLIALVLIMFLFTPDVDIPKMLPYQLLSYNSLRSAFKNVSSNTFDTLELTCNWPNLTLLNPPGPLTALKALPGSGNTWIRHLLQMATGIQTGSVIRGPLPGLPGAGIQDGSVIVINDQDVANWDTKFARLVVVFRDPIRAGYEETGGKVKGLFPKSNVNLAPYFYKTLVQKYNQSEICVLQYDKLINDVIKELIPCIEFLGFQIDSKLAQCMRKEANVYRKPISQLEFLRYKTSVYDTEQLAEFQRISRNCLKHLLQNSINSNNYYTQTKKI